MKAIVAFLVIFALSVTIGFFINRKNNPLPVYRPSDVNPRLVDSDQQAMRSPHRIREFKLVNQFSDTVTSQLTKDKVYIANFFFTRCPTICPIMTGNLVSVQQSLTSEPDFLILSHSVTPEYDTPQILKDYSERFGADKSNWFFLTGDKKEIYDLARRSYFAVLDHGDGGMQDFVHTENVVLIDRLKRIRGFYDGTSESEMARMTDEIRDLLRE